MKTDCKRNAKSKTLFSMDNRKLGIAVTKMLLSKLQFSNMGIHCWKTWAQLLQLQSCTPYFFANSTANHHRASTNEWTTIFTVL